MNSALDNDPLVAQLRKMVVRRFRFDDGKALRLATGQPLFDGSLGLDSLDALEFGMQVEEEFGLTIDNATEARAAFATLDTLAAFIRTHSPQSHPSTPTRWPVSRPALS